MNEFLIFIAGIMKTAPEDISMETKYNSVPQWNSLMQLRLVMEIEDEYEIEIPLEKVAKLQTIGDFYKLIKEADET